MHDYPSCKLSPLAISCCVRRGPQQTQTPAPPSSWSLGLCADLSLRVSHQLSIPAEQLSRERQAGQCLSHKGGVHHVLLGCLVLRASHNMGLATLNPEILRGPQQIASGHPETLSGAPGYSPVGWESWPCLKRQRKQSVGPGSCPQSHVGGTESQGTGKLGPGQESLCP